MFINPEREPANFGLKSMLVAQKVGAANMFDPLAPARNMIAVMLFGARLPNHSSNAEANIPVQTAIRRPRFFPKRLETWSENSPPKGAKIAIER